MRTKNALINMFTGVGGQILTLFLSFITRTVFINNLEAEYLGLNGLFNNILTILSIANLGIGTALTYSFYKPIADKDYDKVIYVHNLLKKSYYIIGLVIGTFALAITPFLESFIKTEKEIPHLVILYFIFILNYIFPYFCGHSYRSVVTANQKEYIYLTTNSAFIIINDILRVIVLINTKSYFAYIVVSTITNIVMFITLRYRAKKAYPYLNRNTEYRMDSTEKNIIIKNIKGTIMYNFGFVMSNGTDSILMSSFVGIKYLGLLSNYQFIISAIQSLLRQLFSSLVASIGNLSATADNTKNKKLFNVLLFTNFWFYSFSSISLFILSGPFIKLWVGEEFIVSKDLILILVANFYLVGMQNASNTYRSAMGLFWYGRYRPILSALVNLLISLVLVQVIGAEGVFLGTLISIVFIEVWYEPAIVFKYGFQSSLKNYFKRYFMYLFVTVITGMIVYNISLLVSFEGVFGFLFKMLICLLIPNIIYLIVFYRTDEFKYLYNFGSKLLKTRNK